MARGTGPLDNYCGPIKMVFNEGTVGTTGMLTVFKYIDEKIQRADHFSLRHNGKFLLQIVLFLKPA